MQQMQHIMQSGEKPVKSTRGRKKGYIADPSSGKSKSDSKIGKNILTISQRLEILREYNDKKGEKGARFALSQKYGISRGRISQILKKEYHDDINNILGDPSNNNKVERKRLSSPKWVEIEQDLFKWILATRKANSSNNEDNIPLTLSFTSIKAKALELAKEKQVLEFTASSGWYSRFIKRVNSMQATVSNESEALNFNFIADFDDSVLDLFDAVDSPHMHTSIVVEKQSDGFNMIHRPEQLLRDQNNIIMDKVLDGSDNSDDEAVYDEDYEEYDDEDEDEVDADDVDVYNHHDEHKRKASYLEIGTLRDFSDDTRMGDIDNNKNNNSSSSSSSSNYNSSNSSNNNSSNSSSNKKCSRR